ncbi:hypothetical protein HOF56_02565 [Candidatus Peribacteria bacterium]|jgi:hypothetical protein|nr:hypothetical protein [Candidatus Peribacteria bacterium]MBT4021321.1 hypothetical protein [Candidatus Peribacteria bacterium]MBT4241218.1 hypothetical protein [Candidatus Peribacteria bacterium]MBT4474243.1 hypothetical protein [Candidatus Peribacteria bacterium]
MKNKSAEGTEWKNRYAPRPKNRAIKTSFRRERQDDNGSSYQVEDADPRVDVVLASIVPDSLYEVASEAMFRHCVAFSQAFADVLGDADGSGLIPGVSGKQNKHVAPADDSYEVYLDDDTAQKLES